MHPRFCSLALLLMVGAALGCETPAAAPSAPPVASTLAVVTAESTIVAGDPLRLHARRMSTNDGIVLRTSVVVTNVSARRIRLGWGGCPVSVELYRTADRSGSPAFDWSARPNPDPCPLALRLVDLATGDSLTPTPFDLAALGQSR
jgi:hypothetical protein